MNDLENLREEESRADAESADRQEHLDMLEELGMTEEEWQANQDRIETELDALRDTHN